MSKVLVTGGRGFLGQHISRELFERGYEVRILARPSGSTVEGNCSEVCYTDIRDRRGVEEAVHGVEYVFHLASNFRKGGSDKKEAFSVNVEGTENVLFACLNQGVKRLIHCSTIGVHGDILEFPATEKTPYNPGDLYQETKMIAEQKVWDFHDKTGLPVAMVRPISLMGPGDTRMLKLFRMIKKGRFVLVGRGDNNFQPAYIDDVVKGFMLCLEKDEAVGEVFIMGGEEYVPLKDLLKLIADELGVDPPKLHLPIGPVLSLARLSELVFVPLGIEPPLHQRRVSFFQNNRAFRIDKAKEMLGYQPEVSLREGIRKTINWYKTNGWL
jgi:dihydroflavonol-4-reductase